MTTVGPSMESSSDDGGKPLQQQGDPLPKIAQPAAAVALPEYGGPPRNSNASTSTVTFPTAVAAAAATRGGRTHEEDDLERGMGINFYAIVDNPLVLASWASFFRDRYIEAVRRDGADTSIPARPADLAHQHEQQQQQQQQQREEHHQRNIFHPSLSPGAQGSDDFAAATTRYHHGRILSKKARTTNNNSYCSPMPSSSGGDLRHYSLPAHHHHHQQHANESEQHALHEEMEYYHHHHHPSVQYLITNIIKSQDLTTQSSDAMETVFRRFPFWCGRAFIEAFYSAAMIGLRWLPQQNSGPPLYTAESFNTPQWRDFLCQDHGFQRFAERRRKVYLGKYAKDIASIAGLYYQSHPKQGKLLLEALLHVSNSSRNGPGAKAASPKQSKEYEEAYNTILTFYMFLYPRYAAFNRFIKHHDKSSKDKNKKPIHEFISFEGEAFVLEVAITSLEEATMMTNDGVGEPRPYHHSQQQQQKRLAPRRPSPSWHQQPQQQEPHCYNDHDDPRNPMWHEGRALSFQRTVEDFHNKDNKIEQGDSIYASSSPPAVVKSFGGVGSYSLV